MTVKNHSPRKEGRTPAHTLFSLNSLDFIVEDSWRQGDPTTYNKEIVSTKEQVGGPTSAINVLYVASSNLWFIHAVDETS
jgi:hypothetical protein